MSTNPIQILLTDVILTPLRGGGPFVRKQVRSN